MIVRIMDRVAESDALGWRKEIRGPLDAQFPELDLRTREERQRDVDNLAMWFGRYVIDAPKPDMSRFKKQVRDDLGNVFPSPEEAAKHYQVARTSVTAAANYGRVLKGRRFHYVGEK